MKICAFVVSLCAQAPFYSSIKQPIDGSTGTARLSPHLNPLTFKTHAANDLMLKLKPAGAALLSLISPTIKPENARSEGYREGAVSAAVEFGSINITDLVGALSMGQVYCAEHFIKDVDTVRNLRESILKLQSAGRFRPSGLSNKAKEASQQHFGTDDRMVSAVTAEDIESNPTLSQIVDEMNSLRVQLGATCANRPSLGRRDLNHELYYSLSLTGTPYTVHSCVMKCSK